MDRLKLLLHEKYSLVHAPCRPPAEYLFTQIAYGLMLAPCAR